MQLIPVAAIVAIILFALKELFESKRRNNERKRKLSAIRSLLATEVKNNWSALQYLESALNTISERPAEDNEEDIITIRRDGRAFYNRQDPNAPFAVSGGPLPSTITAEYNRHLPSLAELDKVTFEEIVSGYRSILELEHVRTSLIDFLTEDKKEWEMLKESFCTYAKEELKDVSIGIRELNMKLTGNDFAKKRHLYRA